MAVLADARQRDDAPVEVFALDALARIADAADDTRTARDLYEEADRRMGAAAHFITDLDRTDAHQVRAVVPGALEDGLAAPRDRVRGSSR